MRQLKKKNKAQSCSPRSAGLNSFSWLLQLGMKRMRGVKSGVLPVSHRASAALTHPIARSPTSAGREDSLDVCQSSSAVGSEHPSRRDVELTILMPCLNEAETIQHCVRKAMGFLAESGISGEVLVADNGSSDGSQELAEQLGARVVNIDSRGY